MQEIQQDLYCLLQDLQHLPDVPSVRLLSFVRQNKQGIRLNLDDLLWGLQVHLDVQAWLLLLLGLRSMRGSQLSLHYL